jgi:hypothetical protein
MLKKLPPQILIVPILVVMGALAPLAARGDGLNISSKLEYADTSGELKNKTTGIKTKTDQTRFSQVYNVNLLKELYPHIVFRAGGLFEDNDLESKTDGTKTDFDENIFRPFAELNLDTPILQGGVAYRKTDSEQNFGSFPTEKKYQDAYSGLLNWRPAELPSVQLNFEHSEVYDKPKTVDGTFDLLALKSLYSYQDLFLDYSYTRTETDEAIQDVGNLNQVHNFGARYSQDLRADLSMNLGMMINYSDLEPSGAPDIHIPSRSGSQSYLLDDSTPEANTAGEFTPVTPATPLTNVNIGLNGVLTLVSMSLDFGIPTEVDTLYVLPLEDESDPTLATPLEINSVAGDYTWRVFTSDDEENWTEQLVNPVKYDIFENRFEVTFSNPANTQYVKISTVPLSVIAPGEIRIADLQPYFTYSGLPGQSIEDTTQNYTLGLAWDVSEDTTANYDVSLQFEETDPLGMTTDTYINGVSVMHRINSIYFANARLVRTDTDDSAAGTRTGHSFSSSLNAQHFDTFRQTLTYSAHHIDEDRGKAYSNSIVLRNSADLYQDLSLNVDLGYTSKSDFDNDDSSNAFLRTSSNIKPHRRLNLNIDYTASHFTSDIQDSRITHRAIFNGFWVPLDTLSLTARLDYHDMDIDTEDPIFRQNYSVNWAPLPDGALDFSFVYSKAKDREGNDRSSFRPGLRWQILNGMDLTLSYTISDAETDIEKRDTESLNATLRLYY